MRTNRLTTIVFAATIGVIAPMLVGAAPAGAVAVGEPSAVITTATPADNRLAHELVTTWFQTLVDKDWSALSTFMSPAFQIVRADGSRATKAEYLASKPDEKSFLLSDMFGTRAGDVLVASYVVKYSTDPASRLTVFTRSDKTAPWQILSTANFNTAPCRDTTAAGVPVVLAPSTSDASAADVARGKRLISRWLGATSGGDKAQMAPLLSPAFQIERNGGNRMTKFEYLSTPRRAPTLRTDGFVVGAETDRLTVSYSASADAATGGREIAAAPTLATFAKNPKTGTWQLVALALMRSFGCRTGG
jgi:hypothetical protein